MTRRKATFGTAEKDTDFGRDLIASAKEALAHRRGEIALQTRIVEPMPASRVKEIRRKVAKSPKEFEARFGVPRRTLEGWEQGRKVNLAERILLEVIEASPGIVENVVSRTGVIEALANRAAMRGRVRLADRPKPPKGFAENPAKDLRKVQPAPKGAPGLVDQVRHRRKGAGKPKGAHA